MSSTTSKIMGDVESLLRSGLLGKFKKYPPAKANQIIDLMDE